MMIKKLSLIFLAGIFLPAYLFATPPCIPSFTTGLEANGDTVCVGVAVSFTNTSDLGGELITFKQWDFDDGSNPENVVNATHIFIQSGTFNVSFTIASASCTGLNVQRTIVVISPPSGNTIINEDASCFGYCDGEAQLDIQIAPHGNYAILWDDINTQTTTTAVNLCAGNYTVNASDVYGCSADFSAVISEPDEIIVDAGSDVFICEGSQWPLSEATVVSGGVGTFDYQWEPGLSLNDPTLLNPIIDVNDPGDFGVYTLTATDDNGCFGSGQLQVIQDPGSIHGTIFNVLGLPQNGILVSLIKRGNDDTQWEIYDTFTTLGDGMFHFTNLPLVDYIVKAEDPGTVPSPEYMPSYYHPSSDTVFDWEEAHITSVDCGTDIFQTDINMQPIPGTMGGDCTFEGYVYLVTIGKTQTEDPIPLIDVIVKKTPPGNAIAWTQTGDDTVWPKGYYRFDSVEVSTDTISFVINIPGLGMLNNYEIIVAVGDSLYSNLNFYVDTTAGTGGIFTYNPLGIEALKYKPHDMIAFPNPFADNCELRFTNTENTNFTFTLFDVTGKQIMRDEELQGNTYTINTQTLGQGIYIAEVRAGDEVFRTRVMKK